MVLTYGWVLKEFGKFVKPGFWAGNLKSFSAFFMR